MEQTESYENTDEVYHLIKSQLPNLRFGDLNYDGSKFNTYAKQGKFKISLQLPPHIPDREDNNADIFLKVDDLGSRRGRNKLLPYMALRDTLRDKGHVDLGVETSNRGVSSHFSIPLNYKSDLEMILRSFSNFLDSIS